MNHSIYLVHASEKPSKVFQRLRAKTDQLPTHWVYLGNNYQRLMGWEQVLNSHLERIHYGKRLQELALGWRRPYVNWVANLAQKHNNLTWWSSVIAERYTYANSLYHDICYLKIGLLLAAEQNGSLLIIAESRPVLETLAADPQLHQRVRLKLGFKPWLEWGKRVIRPIYKWARYLIDSLQAIYDARITRKGKPIVPLTSERKRVIIRSCLDESYFGDDGHAHNRHFSVLPEELQSRGYDVVIIPWLFRIQRSRREAFEWFRQHPERYLIPEDFYTIGDYLWAAWTVIRQGWLLRGPQVFEGLDITRLIQEISSKQSANSGAAPFVQYYRLVQKWQRLGLQVDIYIDIFENLTHEKPLVMALHKYMPEVMTVGFQHYLAPFPLMLAIYTTPEERLIAPHPNVIVCNSPLTAKLFTRTGFPKEKLRIGPSLRHLHLSEGEMKRSPEVNKILVLCAIDPNATAELMDKLIAAFPSHEGFHFWLKPHPMMPVDVWHSLPSHHELPEYMEKVTGSIANWLPKAACAIVIASSSALEVALAGIPVVVMGRETEFDMNPLFWFPEFSEPVHSVEELRTQVLKMLSLPESEREQWRLWGQRARRECFSPVTEDTIRAFLEPVS